MLAPGNSPLSRRCRWWRVSIQVVRPRVPIADDYQGNLDTLTAGVGRRLQHHVYPISKVEALVLSKTQVFDIILSDVLMPEMSGYML